MMKFCSIHQLHKEKVTDVTAHLLRLSKLFLIFGLSAFNCFPLILLTSTPSDLSSRMGKIAPIYYVFDIAPTFQAYLGHVWDHFKINSRFNATSYSLQNLQQFSSMPNKIEGNNRVISRPKQFSFQSPVSIGQPNIREQSYPSSFFSLYVFKVISIVLLFK